MKIVYDSQIFSMQQYGGISRYFNELAKNLLIEKKCGVEIFAPIHINEYLKTTPYVKVFGKKIPHIRYTGRFRNIINLALSRILLRPRKNIDILHETYFTEVDYCPSLTKRIVTVYDMIHEKYPQYFPKNDKTRKRKVHAVRNADHIICISENTRRDIIDLLKVPIGKTSVVHLGYSLSCSSGPISNIRTVRPFILYVGSRWGYKNYELLLKAYASSELLKNEFSIVCFGGGEPTQREQSLISELGCSHDCVTYIEGDDFLLAGLYKSAKAFVYPSLYEGFGIPPLEAMSYGCPVICANASSIPEVVGDAAHLFDPNSESDLRFAMEKVVQSNAYSSNLIAKGNERIKLFSWKKCADDTLSVYKKILGMK